MYYKEEKFMRTAINLLHFFLWSYYLAGIVGIVVLLLFRHLGYKKVADLLLQHGKCCLNSHQKFQICKSKFAHFYALGFASLFISFLLRPSILKFVLLTIHLGRRWYETIFMGPSSSSKMHLLHYFLGISYYLILAVSLEEGKEKNHTLLTLLGVGIICIGCFIQQKAHRYLYLLRKNSSCSSSKQYQKIPETGLFRFILCPHYLAEIFIYFGVWLADGSSLMGWNLAFVISNLSVSAYFTKSWYRASIDRTNKRTALIPFQF